MACFPAVLTAVQVAATLLNRCGVREQSVASNGLEAVEAATARHFDIILMGADDRPAAAWWAECLRAC